MMVTMKSNHYCFFVAYLLWTWSASSFQYSGVIFDGSKRTRPVVVVVHREEQHRLERQQRPRVPVVVALSSSTNTNTWTTSRCGGSSRPSRQQDARGGARGEGSGAPADTASRPRRTTTTMWSPAGKSRSITSSQTTTRTGPTAGANDNEKKFGGTTTKSADVRNATPAKGGSSSSRYRGRYAAATATADYTTSSSTTHSLFVADLSPHMTDEMLVTIFGQVGPVASARVLHDAVTRKSRGCAYVNFLYRADAATALATMNYTPLPIVLSSSSSTTTTTAETPPPPLDDQPQQHPNRLCRIMWKQHDSLTRFAGAGGSVFVQNWPASLDVKDLHETFAGCGTIYSCKVVLDRETNIPTGIANVHYNTADGVDQAIARWNGAIVAGQEITVRPFVRRDDRWTSCLVQNIPSEWDEDRLRHEFAPFGEIVSFVAYHPRRGTSTSNSTSSSSSDRPKSTYTTATDDDGAAQQQQGSKAGLSCGYIEFATHEAAVAAVVTLNGKTYTTNTTTGPVEEGLYVARALRKSERKRQLRARFNQQRQEHRNGVFVKDLADTVTDDMLRAAFVHALPGTSITAAWVLVQDNNDNDNDNVGRPSRRCGFLFFSWPDQAIRAVREMNGKRIGGKIIKVALARPRKYRVPNNLVSNESPASTNQKEQERQPERPRWRRMATTSATGIKLVKS